MKALFISYNGALEPLMQSQGIPYLKGLSLKGIKIILLTFEKVKNKEKIYELKKELKDSNIEWYPFRYHKKPSLLATLFDIATGIMAGLFLVVTKNIDIVHARATVPAAMAFLITKITRRKFIFDLRGFMAEEYADGGIWEKGGFNYRLTLYFQKLFMKEADALLVITKHTEKYLLSDGYLDKKNKNINMVPCCVDTKKFNTRPLLTQKLKEKHNLFGKFIFLYSGSVGTWYLMEDMLDFFIIARTAIPNAHFMILTHVDKEMVKKLCDKKQLSEKDVTIINVEFKDVPGYLGMADAGIFFIKPVFSKRHSCPTKFAEYLACGLPLVINSGIGDTDDIVNAYNLGAVIGSFTNESYIKAVERLCGLIKERGGLSSRCRRAAEDLFSLEDIGIPGYFNIYRRLGCG